MRLGLGPARDRFEGAWDWMIVSTDGAGEVVDDVQFVGHDDNAAGSARVHGMTL